MTTFIQKLDMLIHQRRITRNRFLQDLHLGKNSIVNWESRQSIPNGKTLIKISAYFNVSVDYLLGLEYVGLTEEEVRLINFYRSLGAEKQKTFLNKVDSMTGEELK